VKGANKLGNFPQHKKCCATRQARENGCSVIFPSPSSIWAAISGTKYQEQHNYTDKLCDLLFAWNEMDNLAASVLELKSGMFDVDSVVEQLQNGAYILDDLLKGLPCNFLPVLIHGPVRTMYIRRFEKKRIKFRNNQVRIELRRCGSKLVNLPW
jgi:hypothetical protein